MRVNWPKVEGMVPTNKLAPRSKRTRRVRAREEGMVRVRRFDRKSRNDKETNRDKVIGIDPNKPLTEASNESKLVREPKDDGIVPEIPCLEILMD
jgi:hypothetical protein